MIIRELNRDDYAAAAELKVYSFDEEVAGTVENMLSSHKQRMQIENWLVKWSDS